METINESACNTTFVNFDDRVMHLGRYYRMQVGDVLHDDLGNLSLACLQPSEGYEEAEAAGGREIYFDAEYPDYWATADVGQPIKQGVAYVVKADEVMKYCWWASPTDFLALNTLHFTKE